MLNKDSTANDSAPTSTDADAVASQAAQMSLEEAPVAAGASDVSGEAKTEESVESPEEANRKERFRKRE